MTEGAGFTKSPVPATWRQRGEGQVADYDYHGRLARLLWDQQVAGPLAKAHQTAAESTAVASTDLRQRYLSVDTAGGR